MSSFNHFADKRSASRRDTAPEAEHDAKGAGDGAGREDDGGQRAGHQRHGSAHYERVQSVKTLVQ
jgi:hypothetical protein